MVIEKAHRGHIPGLLRLLGQVGQVHHEIRPDIFRAGALKYDASALEELLRDENRPIFVAVEGETVLGYCLCILEGYQGDGVMTDRLEIYIDDLCVEETCRGQGVAKALYTHTCHWARSLGADFVTLNVWNGNDGAMKFYEKMGLAPRKVYMEMKL